MNAIQQVDHRLAPYATGLFQIAQKLSTTATVTSTLRSRAAQQQLYANYVAGRSRYPAAAPGTSKHERGLAFDLGGLSASQLALLGRIWKSWGGRWGGNFSRRDPIHFESLRG